MDPCQWWGLSDIADQWPRQFSSHQIGYCWIFNIWIFEYLDIWMIGCLDVWIFNDQGPWCGGWWGLPDIADQWPRHFSSHQIGNCWIFTTLSAFFPHQCLSPIIRHFPDIYQEALPCLYTMQHTRQTCVESIADSSSEHEGVLLDTIAHRESLILDSNQAPNLRLQPARLPNVMRQE